MQRSLSFLFRTVCVRGTQALLLASLMALSAVAAVAPPGTVIPNIAAGMFSVEKMPVLSPSNEVYVQVPFDTDRIGVAKQASQPIVNLDATGSPDGTATVSFTLRVRNYGQGSLSKVVLFDQIEGAGAGQLGSYTPDVVPGVGQYTVLPNTLVLLSATAPVTSSALNQGFTGQAGANNLLQGEVGLPRGAEFSLRFEVRYNITGRQGTLYNTARACAQTAGPPPATVCDDSVDGFNPDANGDGDPTNDGSPTPVPTQLPALALLKSVSSPRPTATPGVYEVDYTLSVSNVGGALAPALHLVDNLDCTFLTGHSEGAVASWRLLSGPQSKTGVLTPSTAYTGRGVGDCGSAAPLDFPSANALDLLNGAQGLAPGQSDAVSMTVEITLKPEFVSTGALVSNKAWAWSGGSAARAQTGRATGANVLAWAFSSVDLILQAVTPSVTSFTLRKEGSTTQAEIGDQLDYTLVLQNNGASPLKGVSVRDQLPPGFTYVPGSARAALLSSTAGVPDWAPLAEPTRGANLTFTAPGLELAPKGQWAVRYRVRIGAGVPSSGVAINQAQATANGSLSNLATWRVRVNGGVFADDAFAFGKVFLDCNRDGIQSEGELGIPGVRLMIEDGTSVITDIEGKWSLYGLRPVTHALKIDTTTLPQGARLSVLSNRHAGVGDSQFLDLKKGEWHKANFAVDNCEAPELLAEVKERRRLIEAQPAREADAGARLRTRMDPKAQPVPRAEPRALPASGEFGTDGALRANTVAPRPLIDLPQGGSAGTGVALATQQAQAFMTPFPPDDERAVAGAVILPGESTEPDTSPAKPADPGLEEVLAELDNTVAFIGLKEGAVLPTRQINLRIKGPVQGTLSLKVNGEAVSDKRVGKRVTLESKALQALEFVAVQLKPGRNQLEAEMLDNFGNPRERVTLDVVAPGPLARLVLKVPETAPADGKTPIKVQVHLVDAAGVPVLARTVLNLDTSAGRWSVKDLNPAEPGTQVVVLGGQGEFELLPPTAPGDGRISLSSNLVSASARLAYLPDLRPLTGIGVVEGVIDLSGRGAINLGGSARGAFESELNSFSTQSGDLHAAARTAFFFKGAIRGDYLLTTAYDSDKQKNVQMFRDIQPDQFYPVYGDSSVKTFDAQSVGKLYVRIDKNRSYLLYGDFVTASSPEVRQLSQINRAVSGVRHHYEDGATRVDSYASRDTLTQQIQEFPANGTSGPFSLPGLGDMVANSETVEVLVRDRSQPQTVLKTTALTRFVDYTIEPISKTLLLKAPVSSLDPDLNPQSIRVSYTVDAGGTPFWVAGVDAQRKVNDSLQLGAVAGIDNNPNGGRKLVAATALARVGDKATVSAEVVQTESDLKGSGNAARLELRREDEQTRLQAQLTRTSEFFDNPNATTAPGQTLGNLKLEHSLSPSTKLRAEALYSASDVAGAAANMRGAAVSVQERLSDTLVGELGLRTGQQSGQGAGAFNYGTVSSANGPSMSQTGVSASNLGFTSVRGRLTSKVPDVPEAEVFVEAEQGLNESQRRALAVGGNYRLTEKTRVYGRYALISSLYNSPYDANSTQQNNVGLIGFESQYSEGGRLFNEYRMVDTIDGRGAQAAMGIRQTLKLTEHLRGTGGVEHTGALGGVAGQASTALTGGLDYALDDTLRATGTLELRQSTDSNGLLNTLGVALKIDRDWSLLARSIVSDTRSRTATGTSTLLQRQQIGFAYRPVDQDEWNAIARYEHRLQRTDSGAASLMVPGVTDLAAHIISAQANWQASRSLLASARYAVKWGSLRSDTVRSSALTQLVLGRVTYDITSEWDVGAQAGLAVTRGGSRELVLGAEGGYQLMPNLWMSAGYNFRGLKDPDLGGSSFISKGPYMRMRFKFDENTLAPRTNGQGITP